jgi:hypothetical protein
VGDVLSAIGIITDVDASEAVAVVKVLVKFPLASTVLLLEILTMYSFESGASPQSDIELQLTVIV